MANMKAARIYKNKFCHQTEPVIPICYFIAAVAIANNMVETTSCDIYHDLLVGVWIDETCPSLCFGPILMDSYHNLVSYTFKYTYDC